MTVYANKTKLFAVLLIICFVILALSSTLVHATEDSWTTLEPMPTARCGFGVAVVDGKLYAIGGKRTAETFSSANEKYTPTGYIPEFPAWIILPLFLTATLFAVILKKRVTPKK
jgi:hypothetical protein